MSVEPSVPAAAAALALLIALAVATPVAAKDALTPVETPWQAPGFELPALDGSRHTLEAFRGGYLLVNFWAVWCTPCRDEMPALERAYGALRDDGLQMLAVHAGPSAEQAQAFVEELALTMPVAVDEALALGQWQVRGLPTTYLLDPEGRVRYAAVGERVWDSPEVLAEIRALIQPAD